MELYEFRNSKNAITHFESGETVEEAFLKMLSYANDKQIFNWLCFSTTEYRILHLDYTLLIMYPLSMAKAMREAWM